MKKIGFLLVFLIIIIAFFAVQKSEIKPNGAIFKIYPKSDYQADLLQLEKALRQNHPQAFEFISSEELQVLVKEEIAQLGDSTNLGAFTWTCRSIAASVGCGHTSVFRASNRLYVPSSSEFPVQLNYIGSQLFVINAGEHAASLPAGTEILSINKVSAADLKANIFKHISADGYNKSSKHYKINKYFQRYCPYQLGFPEAYQLKIKDKKSGNVSSINLKPSVFVEKKDKTKKSCEASYCLEIKPKHSTALLSIRSFSFYGNNFDSFKNFIDDSFAQINAQKIKNLIIDLRDNGGGDPYCAAYLLQYIADQSFIYFQEHTNDYEALRNQIIPFDHRFKNEVYVLINGGCFSTTGHLASLIKQHQLGRFIGAETGATYSCNDNSTNIKLDKTNLTLRVARNTFQTAVENMPKTSGILPDYPVEPSIADLVAGKDYILAYALALIDKQSQD